MHLRTDTGSATSHFAMVPNISKPRSKFSLAEKHVTTIQFDTLYPIMHKFIYPGDTLSFDEKILARLQTQIGVLYDDLYIDVHAWFVPMRLLQTNWARFQLNAQPDGPAQDNSALTTPKVTLTGLSAGFPQSSIWDYFGYPTKIDMTTTQAINEHINTYLPRAYNKIWNHNYRDQNFQAAVPEPMDDGPDPFNSFQLLKRGRRHDKFTSALPNPQKGPPVTIPMAGTAPVISTGTAFQLRGMTDNTDRNVQMTNVSLNSVVGYAGANLTPQNAKWGTNSGLIADLSLASGISINAFRQLVSVQHILEADARGGTRDVEAIQNRWGVTVPDFRMQRPEYLGGTTFTFDGHVVPQTSATTEDGTPQANLTQFSQALDRLNINHSFVEHGIFMILVSARSNMTYQNGLQRELSYRTRFDFYQPEFANLGEVGIKGKEINFLGDLTDNDIFGYQEYGYELRYSENRVSGEMRSNHTLSLDSRHMAYDMGLAPVFLGQMIESFTPISRNIAVSASEVDPIELSTLAIGSIARTMPVYSIPGLTRL